MNDPVRIPLSTFERYMLRDHSAEYPMMQLLHVEFRGNLDSDRLRMAFGHALKRHPLLTARVEGSGKRAQWLLEPETNPPLRFTSVQQFDEIPTTFVGIIDPSLGRHLAAWHLPTETGCKLLLSVDHIASDGMGIAQFLSDWLACYQQLHMGHAIEDPNIAERIAELPRRELPGWRETDAVVTFWQALWGFVRETYRWYFRSPKVVAASKLKAPTLAPCHEIFMRTLTAHETRGLRHAALAQQATLNDLLLRDIFLCLARWNAKFGQQRPRDWLRILMPTSLRSIKDKTLSAVNRVGYAFLTHRVSECENPGQLLNSLKQETAAIRKWNLGQMFLDGLAFAEKFPGLVSLFTRRNSCLATTVFSNVGEITRVTLADLPREGKLVRVGEATVERMYGSPPLRSGTRLVILSGMFCDELSFSGLTDSRYFTTAQNHEWWDLLIEQMRQTAAEGWAMKTAKTPQNLVDNTN